MKTRLTREQHSQLLTEIKHYVGDSPFVTVIFPEFDEDGNMIKPLEIASNIDNEKFIGFHLGQVAMKMLKGDQADETHELQDRGSH